MQKKNVQLLIGRMFAAVIFSVSLFSFSSPAGADHFQIYIDKKLVLDQFVHLSTGVKVINLQPANYQSQLDVYYNHCGEMGKARTIVLKDQQDKVIKTLKFKDGNKFMSCSVSDFIDLKKKNNFPRIYLYYAAEQMPEPRLLANIVVNTENRSLTSK
jgi:hypothetical protein